MEDSAQRSLELADRLRLKVVDLEEPAQRDAQVGEATAAKIARSSEPSSMPRVPKPSRGQAAEAEDRLVDQAQLASLDQQISGLSDSWGSLAQAEEPVIDLREAETAQDAEKSAEPAQPPTSRWSEWRAT
jgi:hypothetical protein